MLNRVIYSVVWWAGTSTKESTFLSLENADAFAKRMDTLDLLITRGAVRNLSPEQYKRLSRACVDYEPPKKN